MDSKFDGSQKLCLTNYTRCMVYSPYLYYKDSCLLHAYDMQNKNSVTLEKVKGLSEAAL